MIHLVKSDRGQQGREVDRETDRQTDREAVHFEQRQDCQTFAEGAERDLFCLIGISVGSLLGEQVRK